MPPKSSFSLEALIAEKERRTKAKGVSGSPTFSLEELVAEKERRSKGTSPQPMIESDSSPSPLREVGRTVARTARNSTLGPLDAIDFLATPVREGINAVAGGLGSNYRVPTLGSQVEKAIDTSTGGFTAPQNAREKTEEAMVRGVTSLPAGGLMGNMIKGLSYAPKALQAVGNYLRGSNVLTPSNVAQTAASTGVMQSALNENPTGVLEAGGKGVGASLGTSAGMGLVKAIGTRGKSLAPAVGQALKLNPKKVETFQESGITPTLADVVEGRVPKMVLNTLEYTPGASGPIGQAKALQREQVLEGLGQTGNSLTRSQAGKMAIKGARKGHSEEAESFSERFNKVNNDIRGMEDTEINFTKTNEFFKDMLRDITTPKQQRRFEKSAIGKIYKELYEDAQENGGTLPYFDVKQRLGDFREKITTQGLIGDETQGFLKKVSKVLNEDIKESMAPRFKRLGKDSYDNWVEVNKAYSEYADKKIPFLNEMFKADKKGTTEAFINLLTNQKKGAEKAKLALKGLEQSEKEALVNSIHKELGAASNGSFSPLKWSREFQALDPESRAVLLSPLGKGNQRKIESISESMNHLKSTLEEANTSKSAHHVALGALGAAAWAGAKSLVFGNPVPLAQLATGLFMSRVTSDKIMTNPKFINWMYRGMKAKSRSQFENLLEHPPRIPHLTKTLHREAQSFLHDMRSPESKKDDSKAE